MTVTESAKKIDPKSLWTSPQNHRNIHIFPLSSVFWVSNIKTILFIFYSDTKQMNVYALLTCLFFNKHFITESYLDVKAIFTSTAPKTGRHGCLLTESS